MCATCPVRGVMIRSAVSWQIWTCETRCGGLFIYSTATVDAKKGAGALCPDPFTHLTHPTGLPHQFQKQQQHFKLLWYPKISSAFLFSCSPFPRIYCWLGYDPGLPQKHKQTDLLKRSQGMFLSCFSLRQQEAFCPKRGPGKPWLCKTGKCVASAFP